jgi:DNA-binding LytR/AlgR family response regulator
MMKCIIVDDENLALDLMENNIARIPFLTLVKRCKNAFDAIRYLNEYPVDLMFLDIQMSGITGIEMLQTLKSPPMVILVSAYDNYAIEGFNLDVIDYLVKPVPFERFLKACNKALGIYQGMNSAGLPPDRNYFFVNVEYRQVKINFEDIVYIEAMRDYIRIYLHNQKPVITHMSMKAIDEKLNEHHFTRIHKSYIVNVNRIKTIKRGMILIENQEVPFSENYKDQLNRKLGISAG